MHNGAHPHDFTESKTSDLESNNRSSPLEEVERNENYELQNTRTEDMDDTSKMTRYNTRESVHETVSQRFRRVPVELLS